MVVSAQVGCGDQENKKFTTGIGFISQDFFSENHKKEKLKYGRKK